MPVRLDRGAAHGDAQGRFSGRPRVQRPPSADVHDLAEWATDEVALAVDFLDEAFALEDREGAPQCRRADLVPVGQVGLGRQAFAGFDAAGRDPVPDVVGDVVMPRGSDRSPPSRHSHGGESGTRVYGQQLARLEEQLLGALVKLEEVLHPVGSAAELDDVAALHRGRGHLDVGGQCAPGERVHHCLTSAHVDWSDVEWQGQSHTS